MHEISIAQAIVDLVVKEAEKASAERVVSVRMELGELCGVVQEQLGFCFPIASQGTVAEGAELVIERVAGVGYCPACETEFPMPRLLTPCPGCGGLANEVRGGQELNVSSLEVV